MTGLSDDGDRHGDRLAGPLRGAPPRLPARLRAPAGRGGGVRRPAARRARAGARAGGAGARRQRARSPEQVAAHLLLVPPRGDVGGRRRAPRGRRTRPSSRGSTESATAYLRRALAEPPRRRDLPGRADGARPARGGASTGVAAIEHLTRGLPHAPDDPDATGRGRDHAGPHRGVRERPRGGHPDRARGARRTSPPTWSTSARRWPGSSGSRPTCTA